VADPRLLADAVDGEDDVVRGAAADDVDRAAVAVERIGHRDDGFQRISLSAAGRADIGLTRRHSDAVIEDAGDSVGGDAGTVV